MSQDGGRGGDHGGLLWDPQQGPLSISGNSGGSDLKAGKNPQESYSKHPASRKGGAESDHEIHIWTERERRKKMRTMFSNLQALLPQLPRKADKSTVVDEAVNYIKSLQQTLQKLEKQKLERTRIEEPSSKAIVQALLAEQSKNWSAANSPTAVSIPRFPHCFKTWSSPNVVLNVAGEDAHISVCTAKRPCLLSSVFYVLEKHKLEVVSAQVSSDHFRSMYMIHARASGMFDQFPEGLMIEEIYKLAVGELLHWLST